uniref:sigma factor n=1 Tax=Vulcanococcus sp. TaxID=2856995 RepID=UPI0037DA38F8
MPHLSTDPIQLRNQRVAEHLSLVQSVARHYAACTRERRDDLQQVAALGLIRAAERYDSTSQVPFAAFARPHVRGAVLHYLRDVAPLLRMSRRMQERAQQLNRQGHEALP